MPSTNAELYDVATEAMLERGSGVTCELRNLLQAVFFGAHVLKTRVIDDEQLRDAVRRLEEPTALAAIQGRASEGGHLEDWFPLGYGSGWGSQIFLQLKPTPDLLTVPPPTRLTPTPSNGMSQEFSSSTQAVFRVWW